MPSVTVSARGHSSAGRAPALQAGGRRFDPVWLHQPVDRQVLLLRLHDVDMSSETNQSVRLKAHKLFGSVLSDIVKRRSFRANDHEERHRMSNHAGVADRVRCARYSNAVVAKTSHPPVDAATASVGIA